MRDHSRETYNRREDSSGEGGGIEYQGWRIRDKGERVWKDEDGRKRVQLRQWQERGIEERVCRDNGA